MPGAGSVKAFFKGNGTNVLKIAPETAIKLTMNDILKKASCRGACCSRCRPTPLPLSESAHHALLLVLLPD